MTGSGNDFVLIDNRKGEYEIGWNTLAPRICDRRYGVGADGILVLEKSGSADVRMNYFNADGSYGGMCGNGGRCTASYIMESASRTTLTIEALDYVYHAEGDPSRVKLLMKTPVALQLGVGIGLREGVLSVNYVDTGSPHVVVFRDQLPSEFKQIFEGEGVEALGREIRQHPQFAPEGANVNFVSIIDNQKIAVRTYERGVEAETLACGTGAVASAIVSHAVHAIHAPVLVIPRSADALTVSFEYDRSAYTQVSLEGSVKNVFSGEYLWRESK